MYLRRALALSLSVSMTLGSFAFAGGKDAAAISPELLSYIQKTSHIKEFTGSGGVSFVDNDEEGENLQEKYGPEISAYINFLGEKGLLGDPELQSVFYKNATLMPFEKVVGQISECMESEFDMIILANTAPQGTVSNTLPAAQRIKYIRRAQAGSGVPLFLRHPSDRSTILDFNTAGIKSGDLITQEELIPMVQKRFGNQAQDILAKSFDSKGAILTSSGRGGNSGILTFSGVFRLNPNKPEFGKGMIHNMYINYKYSNDNATAVRDSGVAIHGTPKIQNLGKRDSHGCLRIHPKLANVWRDFAYKSDTFKSQEVLNMSTVSALPPDQVQTCQSGHSPGYKILLVIFDGYQAAAM